MKVIGLHIAIFDRSAVHDKLAAVDHRNTAAVANGATLNAAFFNGSAVHVEGAAGNGNAAAEIVISFSSRKGHTRVHIAGTLNIQHTRCIVAGTLGAANIQDVSVRRTQCQFCPLAHADGTAYTHCQRMAVAQNGRFARRVNGKAVNRKIGGQFDGIFVVGILIDPSNRFLEFRFVRYGNDVGLRGKCRHRHEAPNRNQREYKDDSSFFHSYPQKKLQKLSNFRSTRDSSV